MKNLFIKIRNLISEILYKFFAKPMFFELDPEKVHNGMMRLGGLLGSNPLTRLLTRLFFSYSDKSLNQTICDINFKNPIGLAAGFDKNAKLTGIIPEVGFGHMEIGSVTGESCPGNPERPRLWRLIKSEGLIVYYGLMNDGCEKIAENLKNKKFRAPLGISIAKTNCKETATVEAGIKDYKKAFKELKNIADYITINISCPNAFGGLPFTNAKDLEALLTEIESSPCNKPIFLKLAPDLTEQELDDIISTSDKHDISGFICTNLTKDRDNPDIEEHINDSLPTSVGGISGKPIRALSTKVIRYIYKKTQGRYIIMGCGGVFSAEDAYKKIKAGASLIQMITGMIFEGPQVISEINRGLAKLLKKDGFTNISEAIGLDHK